MVVRVVARKSLTISHKAMLPMDGPHTITTAILQFTHTGLYCNSTVPQPEKLLLKWSTATQFGYNLGTVAVQSCMGVWISLYSPVYHPLRKHNKLLQMLCPLFAVWISAKVQIFLILNFRYVLYVVRFLLGNSPASEFYMPTFRNTLSVPSS